MEYINKTEFTFDIPRLIQEVNSIPNKEMLFHEYDNQICVTQRPGVKDPYRDGHGSLWLKEERKFRAKETEFTEIILHFKGTYIEEIIRTLPMNFGRVRIANQVPKKVYSFHKDAEMRYHLALITNPNAWFIYRDKPPYHIPADSHLYSVNAMERHTAFNLGNENRVHLLFNEINTEHWKTIQT